MLRALIGTLSLAIAAALLPIIVEAQVTRSLKPGAKVRIAAPSLGEGKHPARVLGVRPDEIDFQLDGGDTTTTVSRDQLTSVDRSVGRTHGRRGMAIGALSGIATGVILGLAYEPTCDPDETVGYCETKGGAAAEGAVYLGVMGTMLGGLIGVFTRTSGWAPLPRAAWTSRVSLAVPSRRGAGLTIAF
jgi:hypothetical protein